MTVIATDAGLMPAPQVVRDFRHGMAERYEVVIDFAEYPVGTRVVLRNTSPQNNRDFTNTDKIMAFDVVDGPVDTTGNEVPDVLDPNNPAMLVRESDAVRTRQLSFVRQHGQWTINGTTWQDVIDSGFRKTIANPGTNDVEIWEIRNTSGGWHHPVHVHFVDFRILSRDGRPPMPHELGAKDVVFVGENETVRLLIKFDNGRGRYMIHCHNLVHEDHDMMTQFEIVDDVHPGADPLGEPGHSLPEATL